MFFFNCKTILNPFLWLLKKKSMQKAISLRVVVLKITFDDQLRSTQTPCYSPIDNLVSFLSNNIDNQVENGAVNLQRHYFFHSEQIFKFGTSNRDKQ